MSSYEDNAAVGKIFNIQKYSVHDGPGIRTIVFLKGCPLRCRWCSNPESQNRHTELAYNSGRCLTTLKCRHCLDTCPNNALSANEDGTLKINRELCKDCSFACADACPAKGLITYGTEQSVDEILSKVEQDMAFYSRSSGGMTLSGGEPLMQADFALALLREARRRRIKTAIETCGNVPWDTMEKASEFINFFLFDIKHMDSKKHEEFTSRPNELILENFAKLSAHVPDKTILCRTPVIPDFNDTVEEIKAICEYIQPMPNVQYELLPYHRLGTQKYTFLDRIPPMGEVQLDTKKMPKLVETAQKILGQDRVVIIK